MDTVSEMDLEALLAEVRRLRAEVRRGVLLHLGDLRHLSRVLGLRLPEEPNAEAFRRIYERCEALVALSEPTSASEESSSGKEEELATQQAHETAS